MAEPWRCRNICAAPARNCWAKAPATNTRMTTRKVTYRKRICRRAEFTTSRPRMASSGESKSDWTTGGCSLKRRTKANPEAIRHHGGRCLPDLRVCPKPDNLGPCLLPELDRFLWPFQQNRGEETGADQQGSLVDFERSGMQGGDFAVRA